MVPIIRAFGESVEFKDRFGHLEYTELIRNIYLRLFNREPEPAGAAYYLEALESGAMDLGSIAIGIFDGAQNTDVEAVANKTTAAAYFVSRVEEEDADFPRDGEALAPLLRPVFASPSSLRDVFGSIDRLLDSWRPASALVSFPSAGALLDYLKSALRATTGLAGTYPDFLLVDAVAQAPNEGARIPLDNLKNTVDGLYLLTDRDPGGPDLLVNVGGGASSLIWTNWLQPWYWSVGLAEIAFFNVDDPEEPLFLALIEPTWLPSG
ncbi:MAG: hypothetical protein ACI87W_001600 [Halieaceae bacterium]